MSTELAKQDESQVAGILAVIERAATNPEVDVAKMEKLLEMQERIISKQAYHDYCAAFAEMQAEIPEVVETKKAHNSKYAPLEDIIEQVKPTLQKHGFAVSFKIRQEQQAVTVTAVLMHRGGHSESTEITLPNDNSGSKNVVQAVGSSTSYGKRYTFCAILNIATRNEDDDAGSIIDNDKAAELDIMLRDAGADRSTFLAMFGVDDIRALASKDYDTAKRSLNMKLKSKKKAAT